MSLKVLLADDSMTAQNMAKKILADSGYEVTTVSNGAAAVKKIAEVKPDLVILDIYMPGYTGLEVCERVRANLETSKLPVLLTVGKLEPYRPEDGARVRADGIIVKPFEATDLLGIVKKISEKFAPVARPVPVVEEFPEPAEAEPEYEEAAPPARMEVPAEMAVAPAMELDEMPVDQPAPATYPWTPSPAITDAVPHGFAATAADYSPVSTEPEPGTVTESIPAYVEPETLSLDETPEFEPTVAPQTATPEITPLPELEFTSAPQVQVPIEAAAELELQEHGELSASAPEQDPALVTEASDITQFATSFGVANAEEVPVGTVSGDEPFFAQPATNEIPEVLNAADVFGAPASGFEIPEEQAVEQQQEPEAFVLPEPELPTSEPEEVPAKESLDDFEARVAAAMSAFDQPLEAPAASADSDAVVEQVDTFVGDPEILNPVGVEPVAELEPVSVELEPVEVAPAAEPLPLDVDETMVLPAEALLSLEAEMKKAMELKQVAIAPETAAPAPVEEQAAFATEAEPFADQNEEPIAETPAAHAEEPATEQPEPEPVSEITVAPELAMAAAAAAVPSMEKWNGFGEEKLANAVQVAVERLKPQLIAEIVKALKGSE